MEKEKRPASSGIAAPDNSHSLCRGNDNAGSGDVGLLSDSLRVSRGHQPGEIRQPSLPREARLPINRCNLPAVVLGSLSFQRHPADLVLDGVAELHRDLFRRLDAALPAQRPDVFRDYMTVHFQLEWPEQMGFTGRNNARAKANYIKVIRGWSFDSDSGEGAVLKGWVESRFGLTPRYHREALRDPSGDAYRRYQEMRAAGLYGTNALEAQLDLVYAYCQYELARRHPGARHVTLYRGVNRMDEHERLGESDDGQTVLLFNNLNSFTCNRERAGEFGDYILTVDVPLTKIFFYCGLLPGVLKGEEEFLVIGGVYDVALSCL